MICNLAHLCGGGALLAAAGPFLGAPGVAAAGLPRIGHVGYDRMPGYALKLPQRFGQNRLDPIGQLQNSDS